MKIDLKNIKLPIGSVIGSLIVIIPVLFTLWSKIEKIDDLEKQIKVLQTQQTLVVSLKSDVKAIIQAQSLMKYNYRSVNVLDRFLLKNHPNYNGLPEISANAIISPSIPGSP